MLEPNPPSSTNAFSHSLGRISPLDLGPANDRIRRDQAIRPRLAKVAYPEPEMMLLDRRHDVRSDDFERLTLNQSIRKITLKRHSLSLLVQ
jgi:hypothetical protein